MISMMKGTTDTSEKGAANDLRSLRPQSASPSGLAQRPTHTLRPPKGEGRRRMERERDMQGSRLALTTLENHF